LLSAGSASLEVNSVGLARGLEDNLIGEGFLARGLTCKGMTFRIGIGFGAGFGIGFGLI
jgi:hypothetical protein